jgi:hypothetical protein
MSHDIRDILAKITAIESRLTPVAVKRGLNPQQQSVDQLPALFKPKSASPALSGAYSVRNATRGYMVGEEDDQDDQSLSQVKKSLQEQMVEIEEDMLSRIKKDLTVYLDRLEKTQRIDRELKDKAVDAVERGQAEEDAVEEDPTAQDSMVTAPPAPVQDPTLPESAAVKTFEIDSGITLEAFGDEQQGFGIRRGQRVLRTKFPSLDQAEIAVELFRGRRQADSNQDYLEEK